MRKLMIGLVLAMLLTLAAVVPASAHVHAIRPLADLTCVAPFGQTGGNGTNGTAADDANGGPITGLIPRDTGSAPLTSGDGGKSAPVTVCP